MTGEAGIVLLTPLAFDDLGGGAAGALGSPVLSGYGSLIPGEAPRLRLASAAPNSLAILVMSITSSPIPATGGTFYPNPTTRFLLRSTDSLGRFEINFNWPSWPVGTPLYLQAIVIDPDSTFGASLSNALRGVTQ